MGRAINNTVSIYLMVGILLLFLVLVATGGGLFNTGGFWMADWQHRAFRMLCHQDPTRSFWLNGKPMAVCARCVGIYFALFVTWLLLPLFRSPLRRMKGYTAELLITAVLVNVIDVAGNIFGLWQNTELTRVTLGIFIGIATALTIGQKLFESSKKGSRETIWIQQNKTV